MPRASSERAMPRRTVPPAALSFLDTLSNGFGAIVLLYLVFAAQVPSNDSAPDAAESAELARAVRTVQDELAAARTMLASSRAAVGQRAAEVLDVERSLADARLRMRALEAERERRAASMERMERELRELETVEATPTAARKPAGDDRAYLSSLRVQGERILFLVDRSASMLDETVVNVIRARNLPRAEQLRSPKWRRTVATVDWLGAQLPPGVRFQAYGFNTSAVSLLDAPGWAPSGPQVVETAVSRLSETVPEGGTNLAAAMAVIGRLDPPPDHVYLLVDGLPTQGTAPPQAKAVDGPERLRLFREATRELPPGTAFHVILFPMEGDPAAAPEYWWLSQLTGGSFLVPSADWP
jgi:hypothetical protein